MAKCPEFPHWSVKKNLCIYDFHILTSGKYYGILYEWFRTNGSSASGLSIVGLPPFPQSNQCSTTVCNQIYFHP